MLAASQAEPKLPKDGLALSWSRIGLLFVLQGIGVSSTQIIPLLIPAFKQQFQTSYSLISFCTAGLLTASSAVMLFLSGMLIQRFPPRSLLAIATLCVGVGCLVLAFASRLWLVALAYGILFPVGGSIIYIGASTLVSRWYTCIRGRMLSIVMAGAGTFGIILPPLAATSFQNIGMQLSFEIFALACVFLAFSITLIIRKSHDTHAVDMPAPPVPSERKLTEESSSPDGPFRMVLTKRFLLIATVASICSASSVVPSAYLITIVTEHGVNMQTASYFLSISSACSLAALVVFGRISDSLGQRAIVRIPMILIILACLILAFSSHDVILIVAAALLGCGAGSAALLPGLLSGVNYQASSFAAAMGALCSILALTCTGTITLFGLALDETGDTQLGLLAIISILCVGFMLSYALRIRWQIDESF